MSTPVIGDSAQVKLTEISNYLDIQDGVNMVWPTGIPNQQANEQTSYLVVPPVQETSRQVQFHQFVNWRPGQPLNYNSSSHQYFAAAYTRTPNYVMTDPRRIQGMETTIEYLRELLTKEFSNNVKEKTMREEMKKELEELIEKNQFLQEQLQTAVMSIKELESERKEINCVLEDVLDAQKTLSANRKELLDAQSELVVAQNKISELNTLLEFKVTELSLVNDELIVSNLSLESLKVSECVESSMSAEGKDVAALKVEYELLKDELIATTEKKKIISNQFKELGKKYLYMIEYSGEQMYDEYDAKHVEFIQKLENLNNSASETQSSEIKKTLACLQGQVELLEEFRENFRVTIELLMCRIGQEFALVSDLSIRAPKPSFEIPVEDFDLLFQLISGIGSVELDGELNA
ncbi:centrosomal protein of 83 kDa-like [Daphnia pulicaria]|uniref:centrosomal protein of 83 kDa-like n=1 Tax=Daphnia pulicaria TaxID=35523 RepID=UPI001EECEA71|nr:centrosomal protein of 83 kDa-like [Daphnia pulicaria]